MVTHGLLEFTDTVPTDVDSCIHFSCHDRVYDSDCGVARVPSQQEI